jgi:serine/threonine protein kinase/sugar lactone lactonase YvrE
MEDLSGRELGPYRVLAPLGEGGMAAVFRAYQPNMDRDVALKVLPRHLASDPQFTARFENEARLLARLQHPHILPVFDFGQAEGYAYFVMPLIETGTLAKVLRGQPLPSWQICVYMSQIGRALDYAHTRGLLHRDVKPSNVLVDESGNCLLTDFGIAKLVEGAAKFTATGMLVGTPAYMSPEQGRGASLDRRSDIYSLGVILYELATGRVPFSAETPVAVIYKHAHDPLPPVESLNPGLPPALVRIIYKALAKNPADRFQTAGEMADALDACRASLARVETIVEPIPPPKPTPPESAPGSTPTTIPIPAKPPGTRLPAEAGSSSGSGEGGGRRRAVLGIGGVAAALTVFVLCGVLLVPRVLGALAGAPTASTASPSATQTPPVPNATRTQASTATASQAASSATQPPAATATQPAPTAVPSRTATPTAPIIAPENVGRLVEAGRLEHPSEVSSVAWSPDGRTLATGSILPDNTVRLWNVASGAALRVLRGHTSTVISIAFSPDGHTLSSASSDKTVRLWDTATGTELRVWSAHTDSVMSVAFSPDGRLVASGSLDTTVRLWDAATGDALGVLQHNVHRVYAVAFSPDGRILASAGGDGFVRLWDPQTGAELRAIGHEWAVDSVAFSPDGRTLASRTWTGGVKLWDVDSGAELRAFGPVHEYPRAVTFSPDGGILASASGDGVVQLWNVETGVELRVLREVGDVAAFSPHGRTLATTGSYDTDSLDTVLLWRVEP